MKYLLEFEWGNEIPVKESIEIETDDLNWTIEQIQRHRGGFTLTKLKAIK